MVNALRPKPARGITFWVMLLIGTAACAGVVYVYGLLMRTDELLTAQVRKSLKTMFPDLRIQLAGARFDLQGRIHISDLKILLPKEELPVAECPETILTVDREQLTDQNIVIQQMRLVQPQVTLQQYESGGWNWQLLKLPKTMGKSFPEWIIERGTVFVFLVEGIDNPDSRLIFRDITAHLVPNGKRRYSMTGHTLVDRAGRLVLNGEADLDAHTWDMQGEVKALRLGPDLISLASTLSPELRKNLQETLRRLPGKSDQINDLVLDALADLTFRVSRPIADGEQAYRIVANLRGGQLSHPGFPYMLSELKGQVSANNRQLKVKEFSARSGEARFQASGEVANLQGARQGNFAIQIQQMELDERLRSLLTEAGKNMFDQVEPSGVADVKIQVASDPAGPKIQTIDVYPRECRAKHQKFPYPVYGITGVGHLENQVWQLEMQGMAGKRPVQLKGQYSSQGKADFRFVTTKMPVDDAFYQASPAQLQNVLQALALRGVGNARYRIFRESPQEVFQHDLEARLTDCRMNYRHFPYELHDLEGDVLWKNGNWTFKGLNAQHGDSKLKGEGTYAAHGPQGALLKLNIKSENSEFDPTLLRALPKYWHTTWEELSPQGRFNSDTQIDWQPGSSPLIKINDVSLVDAGMTLRSFPYRLERMTGHLNWAGNQVILKQLIGFNQETRVEFSGEGTFAPQSAWQLHLANLIVDDLEPDRRFRKVLPSKLRTVVDDLDPRAGKVSLQGELDLKGSGIPDDPVTAAWNMQAVLHGSTLTVGLDVNNVHGKVDCEGTWNGTRVESSGLLGLESATVWGYRFSQVKGPFRIVDDKLEIGHPQALLPRPASGQATEIPMRERIQAQAIGGRFTLDGKVTLRSPFPYDILVNMIDSRLENFAMEYLSGQRDLRGLMNGYAILHGEGTSVGKRIPGMRSSYKVEGNGRLQIKPAALYELPVMMQIFKSIQFHPQSRSAFNEAQMFFTVHNNQINLNNIALLGDAINLYGQGYVRFDHRLAMEFFARLPQRNRNQIPIVQGVQGLVGAATTGVWGVSVTGTTSEPVATLRAFPRVDDAFKEFFQSLDSRPSTVPRGMRGPTTTGALEDPTANPKR